MIIKEKNIIHNKNHILLKSDSNKYLLFRGKLYKEIIETPFNYNKVIESTIDISTEGENK